MKKKHTYLPLWPLVWKWVGLQYSKSIPTFIQCQGSLCLKFKRICRLQLKLSHGNHSVYSQIAPYKCNIIRPQNCCSLIKKYGKYVTCSGTLSRFILYLKSNTASNQILYLFLFFKHKIYSYTSPYICMHIIWCLDIL